MFLVFYIFQDLGLGKYKRLGTTIDDALGEAFDKTAKLLGIEFPGGPQIELWAEKGDPNSYDLPKPIINKGGCNLSFAGLKTAIRIAVLRPANDKLQPPLFIIGFGRS